mgnify:CR=1 FL=1
MAGSVLFSGGTIVEGLGGSPRRGDVLLAGDIARLMDGSVAPIPLAVWILEGLMSGVPKELDETAHVDGYSFWRFFFRIFMPTIAAGIGVACFFLAWLYFFGEETLWAPLVIAVAYGLAAFRSV